jgi:hypothetical protein
MNRTRIAAALTLCLLLVSGRHLGADVKADMVLTADTWLAPTIAAMKEIVRFDVRYAPNC